MTVGGGVKHQYLAGICVNIISISYGAFCGWPSASFLELQSDESPLHTGPMSNHAAGWVGAMLCVGGLCGTIFFAWCADKIGRKRSMLLLALPALLGWWTIPFARNPTHLCISRFLGGFSGGGSFSVIPIYTTELSEDRVRGTLGTFLVLSCNIGILFAFTLGYFYSYDIVAWILSSLVVLFVVCFSFLPDTPQHLMKKHKTKEAEKAFRYFRNVRVGASKELPEQLKFELEKLKPDDKSQTDEDTAITWKDLNNRTARKAFIIGIGLMALNQFCGCFAMINYTASIFKQSGSNLSPNVAAVIVAVIQLIGSYISTMLVERAGRKLLLVVSAVGTGIGLGCLGGYSYLSSLGYETQSFAWVPVASFSFTIFIACWGVLTLPFLVVSEVMPPKIRNVGSMVCMSVLWVFAFGMLKYLPVMSEVLGMHGMMFAFGSCCFAGAGFLMMVLPETKGKSIETILSLL